MEEPSNDAGGTGGLSAPPELPTRLLELWPVVVVGTGLWLAAFLVLLLTGQDGVWLWTTLAGWVLGLIGFGVMAWQRVAARRGARGAQRGL
ncbi:DUF2530 domain-containing protein [Amycolatopsis cihanbeyliensis]|uniref:Uncharacterized protein DUF2530 n=1 Tax=Amycolatopsis cihanbeyliensis TaxID=1128664 RepID=A0A542DIG5_AMYCI|nr:DUF2530 domain-containing protein [Amycolatopsis cihanbeyliensis]TQJ02889.1 uncharacterized protein DUF2530 [Amycolatopsis cihanbeyliensis]